jgi:hypothetical protein
MKLSLLSKTALISIGLATLAGGTPAGAAEGVRPGLGGYYGVADLLFEQSGEAREATLDNGVSVGARIEMEDRRSGGRIDEIWAYFKRGWDRTRSGGSSTTEEPGHLASSEADIFGVDSPDFAFGNGHGGIADGVLQTNTASRDSRGDATKIIYFSPTFGGFSFAVSAAPERREEDDAGSSSGSGGLSFSNETGQAPNLISNAVEFARDFGGPTMTSGMNAQLDLTYEGFTLGGAMGYRSNDTAFKEDADLMIFGLGATYNWSPWTVGLSWSHGNYEYASSRDDGDLDIVQFTGRYDLGSGISLDAAVGVNNLDRPSGSPRSDDTAWQAGMGFYIGF